MEQITNTLTPETATDEPVSSFNIAAPPPLASAEPAPDKVEDFTFASDAEEDAYWAGVSDGIRNAGGVYHPRLAARARDAYPELVATQEEITGRGPRADVLDFDPVSTRHRIDGLTPERQREYVEALADSGVARYAAARIGVSEQAVNRLRRRADARSFNLACDAAMRLGARRLQSIAFERAIEGTIRRHYFHGELKSEERVYDNRLLVYLLGKTSGHLDAADDAQPVVDNWQPWMEAIEQGLPEPVPSDAETPEPNAECETDEPQDEWTGDEVWEDGDGLWRTSFPPPPGFDGEEGAGRFGYGYARTLTEAEQAVIDAEEDAVEADHTAEATARRDRYFGFTPDIFPPKGRELYETSAKPPESSEAIIK